MKKLITLLIILSSTTFVYAANPQLSISASSNQKFKIVINNNTYWLQQAGNSSNELFFNNFYAGLYRIQIYQVNSFNNNGNNDYDKNKKRGRGKHKGWDDDDDNIDNINNAKLIYQSAVYLKDNFFTDILISRFGKVFLDEGNIYNQNNNPANNWPVGQSMEQSQFNVLKIQISNEPFDRNKINLISQAASYNYFSTYQVRELMRLFAFDDRKLEVAKILLSRVTDRNLYYTLNDEFIFSKTKDEFKDYLQSH